MKTSDWVIAQADLSLCLVHTYLLFLSSHGSFVDKNWVTKIRICANKLPAA